MEINRWSRLMANLEFSENRSVYDQLSAAYNERHRKYHNQAHIEAVLSTLDICRDNALEPDHVEIALWFHDAIYKIFSTSNEEDSANWAREFVMSESDDTSLADSIYSLIMVTQHNATPDLQDEQLIVDIDLSILGSSTADYDRFEQSIREEYKLIPWLVYRKKRIEILNGFLERPQIFSTNYFRHKHEVAARTNLSRAIETLQGKS